MGPKKIERRRKPYSEPKLTRLDPQEALARVETAARAGNKSAQTLLDRISKGKASLTGQ